MRYSPLFLERIDDILAFFDDNVGIHHLSTLYAVFPDVPKASMRRILQGMAKKDQIRRVKRGYYQTMSRPPYQDYLFTIRVRDTHMAQIKNAWSGVDAEATILGTVPVNLSHNEIADVLRPKLIDAMLEMLSDIGVYLVEEGVEFGIEGAEWRQATSFYYNRGFVAELLFTSIDYNRSYSHSKPVYIEVNEW